MKPIYVTFDRYYNVDSYNTFLSAAKNNNIEIEQYISIKPPYYRYIKINSKEDLPTFVNYDFATVSEIKWLVSTIKPTQPNEAYKLKRREGKDNSYWNYIIPKELENVDDRKYLMIFKSNSNSELREISSKLGKSKIYKLGRSKIKGYKIYYTFNPYIRGLLENNNKLLEYGVNKNESLAQYKEEKIPKVKGEIEIHLNNYILIKEKLEDKTYEAEYWQDGKINPLSRETFI